MEPVELVDGDLLLRPWQPQDAEAVHRACQDPEIQRWTTVPRPYLPEHAEHFVSVLSPQQWAEGTGAPFGMFDAGTGQLLGSNGLITIDRRLGSAEIGYWTAPAARGRGVTARACRLLARWAFEQAGLSRLVWQAILGNHASRLTALRAGFRIEGRLRLATPAPDGAQEGWLGSMLPADLAADPPSLDPVAVRRARVFSAEPPVLRADATGGPITLRRATERDVERMVVACRDPEALKWTSVPDPYHRENAEWYVGFAAEQWAAGAGALFGVYDPSDTYCGSMDLRLSPTDPGGADVGYLMSPDIRGRGYATAALRALCEWGVPALGLQRVEWRAHVGNLASRRVAEKAGFTVEGMLRSGVPHGGGRADCWLGSLLASDLPTPSR